VIGGVQNIGRVPELQRRILFTFGMLAVYRLGAHIVTPGINPDVVRSFFDQMANGGSIFGLFNLFSGGALQQLSVFTLGIMPYISASIIFQLLAIVVPQVEQMQKEGEQGRRKITQWTRYSTIGISAFQAILLAFALENGQFGANAVMNPGWSFRIMTMITLTTGTAFIMWLGEQITERGIGNGISLIIFAGIVVRLPSAMGGLFEQVRTDQMSLLGAILLLAFVVLVTGIVVICERAQRRIPIQHARRVVGRRVMQGGMSYFPLRLNTAGVIPPIFASSILMFPLTISQFVHSDAVQNFFSDYLSFGGTAYDVIYVALIVFFAYFYTAIVINPTDVADNIKRSGAYIPGIRPGKRTAEYIDRILGRLTLLGAIYVSAVCVMPIMLSRRAGVPFYFGGTALLIVVGVALDTIGQIEAHLVSRQYEGFVKGTRMRGRLGR
jgi:preprotein translocase subunit SecY